MMTLLDAKLLFCLQLHVYIIVFLIKIMELAHLEDVH